MLHGTVAEGHPTDGFAWMRDPADPRLLANLRAEREQYDRATVHLRDLRETLFGEVGRRLVPTDESVSIKRGAFFYYTRSVTGSEYEQFLRTRNRSRSDERAPDDASGGEVGPDGPSGGQVGPDGPPGGQVGPDGPPGGEIVLDEAALAAEPGGYVALGVREPSPDGRLLAYSVDTDGDEVYVLRFRDMTTGTDLPDISDRTYYGGAWSADSTSFFYTVHDDLYRPYQVWRHRIGTPATQDALVFVEDDARFELTVGSSTSGAYIFIVTACRDTTEVLAIPAGTPETPPRVIRPREKGIEYAVDHLPGDTDGHEDGHGDGFAIVTNLGAEEFRLMRAPAQAGPTQAGPTQAGPTRAWTELAPDRPGERLRACHVLAGHLVLELRRDGYPLLRAVDRRTGAEREITAGIPAGRIVLHEDLAGVRLDYDATSVVVKIESLVQPPRWFDVDLATGERRLLKALEVPGYDPAAYTTQRRHAPAPDGVLVPVTLAFRAGIPLDGSAPCLMWGYGAYESCDDPEFDPALASLLDRGYVYGLTHPRGGGENGRAWWRDGHLAAKRNTFSDHLAVANWLAGAAPDAPGGGGPSALVDGGRIATRGLSAGGLLQARVAALAPRRFAAVVAEVPFVDVIGSMSDPTIPLTINEWDEWGDPRRPEDHAWMRAYSPYDNPPASPRPPMLVTAALHDPRVLVHEPAKYVAKLRSTAAPGDDLLFRVELGAGAHTGPSGRYAHYRYEAEIYAYVIDRLSRTGRTPAPGGGSSGASDEG